MDLKSLPRQLPRSNSHQRYELLAPSDTCFSFFVYIPRTTQTNYFNFFWSHFASLQALAVRNLSVDRGFEAQTMTVNGTTGVTLVVIVVHFE